MPSEQQALLELLPQLPQPGLGTISDDNGPAATCRSMDLAAADGARRDSQESTMGRQCSWRTRTGATPCNGTDDYATAGSGQTRQSGAWNSENNASQLDATCAGYLLF